MNYHKFRFGFIGNIMVLLCRLFGHRLNENPSYHWCERCKLDYSEIYYPIDFLQATKDAIYTIENKSELAYHYKIGNIVASYFLNISQQKNGKAKLKQILGDKTGVDANLEIEKIISDTKDRFIYNNATTLNKDVLLYLSAKYKA